MCRASVEQRLGEHRRVAEAELRLGGALAVRVVDLVGAVDLAHSAPAAAREGLDHDRAVLRGEECADVLDAARPFGRGQHRHPGGDRGGAGRGLVADQLEHVGVRPHERVAGGRAGSGEFGVLAEEPVTRVNQVGTRLFGRVPASPPGPGRRYAGARQTDRFVGRMHVRAVGIVVGVDRDRLDAQFGCRADDSKRDLAAVCDQQGRPGVARWKPHRAYSTA